MKREVQPTDYKSDFVIGHLKANFFNGVSLPLGYSMYCMQSRPVCMRMCC
jgi:hypothetical protein